MFDPAAANSRIAAETVARWWAQNPIRPVNDKDGKPTGEYITGPVRLSFPNLFTPGEENDDGKRKYTATALFPAGVDLSLLKKVAGETAIAKWPNAAEMTLHSPFRDQSEKKQFDGYVPGSIFLTANGERKPYFVDQRAAPITDTSKEYPGAWVLLVLRPYSFDVKKKKGVSFGLQGVVFVADDTQLGGGGSDPNAALAGVNLEQEVNPAALFGGASADKQVTAADLF